MRSHIPKIGRNAPVTLRYSNDKVDASRRAEKCRSLRVKVEAGVSGCALRPILPSAPYSLPPQRPFRPILPSAPYSRPPHTPVRPILPSAPYSRPPHTPVRPRLGSTPGSLPPQAPPTPLLALRACVGCQRILTSRSQVWRRGACQLAYIDARCMLSCASAPRLICCRVAGWHVIALVHAFDSANSERPTAGARANSLSS